MKAYQFTQYRAILSMLQIRVYGGFLIFKVLNHKKYKDIAETVQNLLYKVCSILFPKFGKCVSFILILGISTFILQKDLIAML